MIDFLGIVLHPTRLGVVLLVVDIGASHHTALLVEQQGLGRRRTLVNSDDVIHSGSKLFTFPYSLFPYKVGDRLCNALGIHAVVVEDFGIGTMHHILVGDTDDADGNGIL